MNATTPLLRHMLTLLLVLGTVSAAHAQLPTDNDVWKSRCALLSSSATAVAAGKAPAALVAATRGVAGAKFLALAINRSQQGQHNVACALFYLSAIADRAGNGGKPDTGAADTAITLAGGEVKQAHGQSLSFSENMKWASIKVGLVSGVSLTSADTESVLTAATTMPLSLTPSGGTQMASVVPTRIR